MSFKDTNVLVCGARNYLDGHTLYTTVIHKPTMDDNRIVLTQDMMSKKNTKYIIKWNFVLGEDITVPKNCLIEFDGGSISNDNGENFSLTGQDTYLLFDLPIEEVLMVPLLGTFIYGVDNDKLDNTDGMAKIYLKRDKSFAEQVDVHQGGKPNTIYVIRYDFTLEEDVTLPENCVLEFDGGSLSNGTLVFQNTYISCGKDSFVNIGVSGTIQNKEVRTSSFKDTVNSDDHRINNLIGLNTNGRLKIIFDEIEYHISNPIVAKNNVSLVGLNPKGFGAPSYDTRYSNIIINEDFEGNAAITNNGLTVVDISGLSIKCGGHIDFGIGNPDGGSLLGKISKCYVSSANTAGIYITDSEGLDITNCRIFRCFCGIIVSGIKLNNSDIFYNSIAASSDDVIGNNNSINIIENYITNCKCNIFLNDGYEIKLIGNMTGGSEIASIFINRTNGCVIESHYSERDGECVIGAGEAGNPDKLIGADRYYQNDKGLPGFDNKRCAIVILGARNIVVNAIVASYHTYTDSNKYGLDGIFGIFDSTYEIGSCQRYDLYLGDTHSDSLPIVLFPRYLDGQVIKTDWVFPNGKIKGNYRNKYGVTRDISAQIGQLFSESLFLVDNNVSSNITKRSCYEQDATFVSRENGISFFTDNSSTPTTNHEVTRTSKLNVNVGETYKACLFIKLIDYSDFVGKLPQLVIMSNERTYTASLETYNNSYTNFQQGKVSLIMLVFTALETDTDVRVFFQSNNIDTSKIAFSRILISKLEDPISDFWDITTPLESDVRYSYNDDVLCKDVYWDGSRWKEDSGATAGVLRTGTTADRPIGSSIYVGFQYFDTSLSPARTIWASAISGDTVTWVDATGAQV